MIEIKPVSPRAGEVRALVAKLDDYQSELYPAESNHLDSADELERADAVMLGAYQQQQLLGCGAVKVQCLDQRYGELKRMFVQPAARGKGVGKALLSALEAYCQQEGVGLVRLETGIYQPEALALYASHGYRRIAPFGGYPDDPLSVFMEKALEKE